MKKLLQMKTMLLLCALIAGSGSVWAEEETFTFGKTDRDVNSTSAVTKGDVTVTVTQNGATYAPNFTGDASDVRFQAGNKMSIVSSGVITKVVLSYTTADYAAKITASSFNVGSYSYTSGQTTGTWTGSTSSLEIVNKESSQSRISQIVVTYTPASTAALSSIKVEGIPATFCLGDAFNTTGMTVTAVLEDDTEKDVTDKADFTAPDMTTKGTKEVTVSYTENEVTKNTSYDIYVNGFTGLSLSGTYKTEFWTNEVFSHDGVVVKAEFENDNEKGVDDAEFSSPDMSTAGGKTVTVSYTIEGVTKSANYNITVTDKPLYTITWMVNGVKHSSRKVTMDELIGEFPTPSAIDGKTFAGWVTTATVAPDYSGGYVNTETATATGNITYYAVFAEATPGEITDVLTREGIGVTGTSYSTWSGKKFSSDAVYAGNSAGGNEAIQMRAKDNSGIVTTVSGGKIKKVVLDWNSNTTSGRSITVYGSNSAYTGSSNLYSSSTRGTSLGSISDTETELEIDDDYEYIGLLGVGGAMYFDKISITWDATTYTYTTTPAAVGTTVTVGSTGYATFVYPYAVAIPANVEAYVVKEANSTSAKFTAVENNIPANTPVVLKAAADDYTFNVADGDVDAIAGNLLAVSTASTTNGVYVLANGDEGIGFYEWNGGLLGAGRVYLPAPAAARSFLAFDFDEESTGIDTAKLSKNAENGVVYNLAGQRVANPAKGLYIVNGKKVIIK